MPWKLVSFLCALILITLFIGFNLENRCDLSFVFYTFRDVPIFVSLLFAFVAGAVTVIPFFLVSRSSRNRKNGGKSAGNGKASAGDRSPSASGSKTRAGRKSGGSPANPRYYDID